MSHFSVLVLGDDHEFQLVPFHEFECTGEDDEFVLDVDKTEEERSEYASATISMVRLADGREFGAYDDICYREPTPEEVKASGSLGMLGSGCDGGISYTSKDWGYGCGYRAKVHYLPEGATEFEKPHPSFAAFLRDGHSEEFIVPHGKSPDLAGSHKYGYALADAAGEVVKVVRRTNPNRHWDWWVAGGRWSNWLLDANGDRIISGKLSDIGWTRMRDETAKATGQEWDKVRSLVGAELWKSWPSLRDSMPADEARAAYNKQPALDVLRKAGHWDADDFLLERDAYVAQACLRRTTPHAIVQDRKWSECGRMGWWGTVSGEMTDGEWSAKVAELLTSLPPETRFTVVDCHI